MKRILAVTACALLVASLSAGRQDTGDVEDVVPVSATIARQRRATIKDGYLVVALLAQQDGRIDADARIETMSFSGLRRRLVAEGIVAESWSFDPAAGLERDVLAYMAASYLDIRPGLLTSLFGMTRRYAYREMQFRSLMVQGQPRQVVSGSELLSVMTRVAAEVDLRNAEKAK